MIGYVTLGTNDLARASAYYDALLGDIGATRTLELERLVAWGTEEGSPMLGAIMPFDGNPATVGNGTMVGLNVGSTAKVDEMYAKALELGGTDEGAPGERMPGFYAGYFRDLDGNKLNFFCMG
ncbi:MAG: VOC family protein [Gammaproteobacteria bacterium]|nr:VOC family protein [Gammaproteobacteria bacterium]MCK5669245.1 VOC family protein [Gammaproteobacteria bacterium]